MSSGNDLVTHLKEQLALSRNEIENLRQQLTGLKHAYTRDCEEVQRRLQNWRCEECRTRTLTVEQITHSGSQEITQNHDLPLSYIGTIFTHFPEKRGTPRQPGICNDTSAKLVLNHTIFTNPEHSLEGLEDYSHMWILFHFHKNGSTHTRAKVSPPRLNGTRTGVFATRSPHRPCPIGLSLVRINRVFDNVIYFDGVDMINQTPVLDIKPYIPQYDSPQESCVNIQTAQTTVVESSSLQELENFTLQNNSSRRQHILDGEEDDRETLSVATVTPTTARPNVSGINLEESYHEPRSVSRIGEREAPDGEEEETATPPALTVSQGSGNGNFAMPHDQSQQTSVRIPNWIDHPPVSTLDVYFTQKAQAQLHQLGVEGERKKNVIKNILQEDPRSVYLRERVENTNYVFRIAELFVSCKFDDISHSVRVFQVFKDSVGQGEE